MIYNRSFANEGTQSANCHKAMKVIGDEFRLMGKWLNDGITQAEYDTLSNPAKEISAYKPMLTEVELRDYQDNIYEPRADAIQMKIADAKDRARNDVGKFHNINLNTSFIDG